MLRVAASNQSRLRLRVVAGRRAHLAAHPEAQADWEAEAGLNDALGRLPDVAVSSNFTARVLQAVEREIAPLVLTGPPSVTGFAGGRPAVEEIVAYWPALIDRTEIAKPRSRPFPRARTETRYSDVRPPRACRSRRPLQASTSWAPAWSPRRSATTSR